MDFTLLHPKLVHLPIALGVLMPLMSLGALLAWWRGWLPKRAWAFVVALQALLVLSGVAALRTGSIDEERVERVVAEARIEAHEEAAELFVWGAAGVLAVALAVAAVRSERTARAIATLAMVGTFGVLYLGYRTGEAGGRLVYQDGAASAFTGATGAGGATEAEAESKSAEHDDDD